MPIRVAIAEDDLIVREGILRILHRAEEVEVVADCSDADGLWRAIETHSPEVVVTDIRMPPGQGDEGIEVAARLREERPEVGVVVLSAHADPQYVTVLVKQGFRGRAYLLKERVSNPMELIRAVREVASGGSIIDPRVVEALIAERARHSPLEDLTPRERDILAQIAQGKSNQAIAESLVLTKRAIEKHVNSIFPKLGLRPDGGRVDRRVSAALLFLSDLPAEHE